jgi:arylsulfatase A
MKCILIALTLALGTVLSAAPAKPNVIIFFMDDLGYGDLRIDGAKDVRTPHLDRLAREGVRLTHCYAAAPVCTPTRAAFMTGRYQHRVGLEDVIAPSKKTRDQGLSSSEPTLPRAMKDAGYATGLFGKWHLGTRPDSLPNRHGFDEFFGFLGGAVDYYSHLGEDGKHDLFENDKPFHLKGYLTDEITARTVSFIERNAGKPFFIDVAYNATHWPFQPPGLTEMPVHPAGGPVDVLRAWAADGTRADYVRMLESADAGVGKILATIERLGLKNDTLVIFTSDNGGEWLSRMGPLFHRKGSLWEGGVRVPCVLRWPAGLPGRRTSTQPAITMDLTATILAVAGVPASATHPLDGVSLIPLLQKNSRPVDRTFFWLGPQAGSADRAVREGRWKYIAQSPIFPGQLFDVVSDPGERRELGARHPDVLKRLRAKQAEWESTIRPVTGAATP